VSTIDFDQSQCLLSFKLAEMQLDAWVIKADCTSALCCDPILASAAAQLMVMFVHNPRIQPHRQPASKETLTQVQVLKHAELHNIIAYPFLLFFLLRLDPQNVCSSAGYCPGS
jgi:hypothetical protein